MKALLLAGGRGKRLGSHTADCNKSLLEYNGKVLIEHSLDNACAAGVEEIVILVGYRAEDIINRYGTSYNGTRIQYTIQWDRKGLVHAVECATEALDGHDFMLFLADEIMYGPRHQEMVRLFDSEDLFAVCGVVHQPNKEYISKTYAIIEGENRDVYRLIEKPRNPFNNVMGTGNCIFRNSILSYIEETPINHQRNEKELVDLIQCAIDDGHKVRAFDICDKYVNVNTPEDVIEAGIQ
jgi:glucose-1-phosphate thymidylyltransferase